MVRADGPGPVAQIRLQLHQGAIADLFKGLELNPAPGGFQRPGEVTCSRPRGEYQVAQVHALALELRPGLKQPVFVYAGQQLTPVRGGRRGCMHQDPSSSPAASAARADARSMSKTRRSTRHVVVSRQHRSLGVTTSEGSSPRTWRRWCNSLRRFVSACASVDSGQSRPAIRCLGCGDPACTARKATKATTATTGPGRFRPGCRRLPAPPGANAQHADPSLSLSNTADVEKSAVRVEIHGDTAGSSAERYSCVRRTAVAPSPTADATRLIDR